MRRILYLDRTSEIGGAESSLLLLLRHLDRNRYDPLVVLPGDGSLNRELSRLGVPTQVVPLHTLNVKALNPFPYLDTVWRLRGIIRRERVDLVHANDLTANQYGVVAARLAGRPIICHLRNLCNGTAVKRGLLAWSDHLIANSQAVRETYLACNPTPQKVTVIYNGVDLSDYNSYGEDGAGFRRRFDVPEDVFLLGIVGRVLAAKGHHILIRALTEVARNHREDVRLAIIGPADGPANGKFQRDEQFVAELRQSIRALGLNECVSFWGEQRDMAPVYRALDLLVLPTFEEGFGRVLIEAMSAERPVVASAVGGTVEVVEAGATGLLVPPGDVEKLAEAICTLASNPEMARHMGIEGRKRVERLFTIQQNVAGTEALYERILSCRGRSA